jgi:predicted kinase
MQTIIFIGIPATGKSTFFRERFFDTHVRLNLDMLRTRHRERILLQACIDGKQPFVVDNTNATVEHRKKYIQLARPAGFEIVGYYFQSKLEDALERNRLRPEKARIPDSGVRGIYGSLVLPTLDEGFDMLYYVQPASPGGFLVKDWIDEVQ